MIEIASVLIVTVAILTGTINTMFRQPPNPAVKGWIAIGAPLLIATLLLLRTIRWVQNVRDFGWRDGTATTFH